MNKRIKDVIKGIVGINYRTDTGKVRVREYIDGGERTLGQGNSLSEALVKLKGNHWIDKSPTRGTFGFIYSIIDTKEKMSYIGRKQELYYDKEKSVYSIPSGWEAYKGSCKPLAEELEKRPEDFLFYRILNCKDRDQLGFAEHFFIRAIFDKRLVTDELVYYNGVIPRLYRGQVEGVTEEFKEIVHGVAGGL